MVTVRFTRRCFREDLKRLTRRAAAEALDAADALKKNPGLGDRLDPPLDRYWRLRIAGRYRLIYTHEPPDDTWWIVLVWERKPGKTDDVYQILRFLAGGVELR